MCVGDSDDPLLKQGEDAVEDDPDRSGFSPRERRLVAQEDTTPTQMSLAPAEAQEDEVTQQLADAEAEEALVLQQIATLQESQEKKHQTKEKKKFSSGIQPKGSMKLGLTSPSASLVTSATSSASASGSPRVRPTSSARMVSAITSTPLLYCCQSLRRFMVGHSHFHHHVTATGI